MTRAVIYCRCSTEEECQKDALIRQAAEARECVCRLNWSLEDEYIESRSGTSTRGREQYQRLFSDLLRDKFEIVVIKSQDRLMRNTKDWYVFVDRLVTCGKRLYLYLENRFYSADDSLITGIKAILAEEYSRMHLAKFQVPRYFIYMNGDDWPRTATGKVQTFRLKEMATEKKAEFEKR